MSSSFFYNICISQINQNDDSTIIITSINVCQLLIIIKGLKSVDNNATSYEHCKMYGPTIKFM